MAFDLIAKIALVSIVSFLVGTWFGYLHGSFVSRKKNDAYSKTALLSETNVLILEIKELFDKVKEQDLKNNSEVTEQLSACYDDALNLITTISDDVDGEYERNMQRQLMYSIRHRLQVQRSNWVNNTRGTLVSRLLQL